MKNVLNFTNNFTKKANIGEGLLSLKPATSKGMLFKVNALKSVKESAITPQLVVGLIHEANRNHTQDSGIMSFAKQLTAVVSESQYAVALAFLHTNLMESDDVINKSVLESIEECINEGEDAIGASVVGGSLSTFKSYFADLKVIENMVVTENIQNHKKIETSDVSIYSPVSYVQKVGESDVIRIGNEIFAITESGIVPTQAPDANFVQMSEVAKNVEIKDGSAIVETALGTLFVEGENIGRIVENEKNVVESTVLINEFASAVSAYKVNESEMTKLDSLVAISNNHKDFKLLENFKVVKNNLTKEVAMIGEHNGMVVVGILESTRTFKQFNTVNSITEAVVFIKNTIGVDASGVYVSEMEDEQEEAKEKEDTIKEMDTELENLEAKKKEVGEAIERVEEGSDAYERYIQLDILISEKMVEVAKKKKDVLDGVSEENKIKSLEFIKINNVEHSGQGKGAIHTKIMNAFSKSFDEGVKLCKKMKLKFEHNKDRGILKVYGSGDYSFKFNALVSINESQTFGTFNITDENALLEVIQKLIKKTKGLSSKIKDAIKTGRVNEKEVITESTHFGKISDSNALLELIVKVSKKSKNFSKKVLDQLTNESQTFGTFNITDENALLEVIQKLIKKTKGLSSKIKDAIKTGRVNEKEVITESTHFGKISDSNALLELIVKVSKKSKKFSKKVLDQLTNEAEGGKEAYQKFLDDKLKGMGKDSLADLSDEETKKFFEEVDKEWKADDETSESDDSVDDKDSEDKDEDDANESDDDKEDDSEDKNEDDANESEDDKEDDSEDKDEDDANESDDDKEDDSEDKDEDDANESDDDKEEDSEDKDEDDANESDDDKEEDNDDDANESENGLLDYIIGSLWKGGLSDEQSKNLERLENLIKVKKGKISVDKNLEDLASELTMTGKELSKILTKKINETTTNESEDIKSYSGKEVSGAAWEKLRKHKDVKKVSMLGKSNDNGAVEHEIILNDKSSFKIYLGEAEDKEKEKRTNETYVEYTNRLVNILEVENILEATYKEGDVIVYKDSKDGDGDKFTPSIRYREYSKDFSAFFGSHAEYSKNLQELHDEMKGAGFKVKKFLQKSNKNVNESMKDFYITFKHIDGDKRIVKIEAYDEKRAKERFEVNWGMDMVIKDVSKTKPKNYGVGEKYTNEAFKTLTK